MKLLLTSAGITNQILIDALAKLIGRPFSETKMVFIPTAANAEEGDKDWLIDDMVRFKDLKPEYLDIVDISALPKEDVIRRLNNADVLIFGGGNNFYLMDWINKLGLDKELPEILKDKVYVGISAGSMIAGRMIDNAWDEKLYGEVSHRGDYKALDWYDLYVLPHLYSPYFAIRTLDVVEEAVKDMDYPVYAIDDDSAIMIDGDDISVVSSGNKYRVFDKK
jgi:dipeptidase E